MKLSDFTKGRDNNFNLIRIIAALAVLVSHSYPLSGIKHEPAETVTGMTLGTMALDVFFITSGFLVSGSLFIRRSALEYFCARALRIFPALLVMVGVTVLCVGVYFTAVPLASYFAAWDTYKYVLKNSTLIAGTAYNLPGVFQHNPFKGSVNGSLWSMPYEIRLYAILAIIWVVLRVMPQKRVEMFRFTIVSCAVLAGVWHIVGSFYPSFGHGFSHLFFMFFSGASFYMLKERVPLSWLLFWAFALTLLFSTLNSHLFFVAYSLLVPYTLLFLAYVPSGFVRAYNRLGDYSYGLYIYAFPVQQSVAALFPGISPWRMTFISAPVAVALAALSWHLVEKNALGLKSRLLDHTRRIVGRQPAVSPIREAAKQRL